MHQIASEIAGREYDAHGIDEQTEGIEDEYHGLPLVRSRQEDQYEQQHERGPNLRAKADAEARAVESVVVNDLHVDSDDGTIRRVHGDVLVPWIESGGVERWRRCYRYCSHFGDRRMKLAVWRKCPEDKCWGRLRRDGFCQRLDKGIAAEVQEVG